MSAVLFIVFGIGLAIGVPIAFAMGGAGLLALNLVMAAAVYALLGSGWKLKS